MVTLDTNLVETRSEVQCHFIDAYCAARGRGGLAGIGCMARFAQEKHGILASYVVAHAALETGWGQSRIAMEKNNLFGWGAFDASPYDSAKGFPNFAHCVDFVMGRVVALYLTPGGRFFVKAPVLGRRGRAGYGMNVHYATDPDWGRKIARIANHLEASWNRSRNH